MAISAIRKKINRAVRSPYPSIDASLVINFFIENNLSNIGSADIRYDHGKDGIEEYQKQQYCYFRGSGTTRDLGQTFG
ncbi:hypothetical protein [Paenibacillus sp. JJ-100]|uniref:hypothetical protein n=1 Tax=Paenibacillus sp. JJ-100 TaxID=2974896 RepID=UPI00233157D7|nr:hypothetical protein [Paenibacillus sp. JJ-100]